MKLHGLGEECLRGEGEFESGAVELTEDFQVYVVQFGLGPARQGPDDVSEYPVEQFGGHHRADHNEQGHQPTLKTVPVVDP